ncbi:MAG: hypothetical protein A3K19_10270 [Lentisphaerae bacterium RIFOXYB12_FULL_65_16]|nr:MAG: hypothetical protein A3K18_32130 [Lentisphaerae bacterium RIFOXYA12_64_32]OGV91601.1 MAG: hypothetical protein A3K19_10270 [Lentisphaerae bacterium RIFOXYB12_FULL_65_16]
MTLKPWREVAVPHDDVLRGTFQQAEFAADISRVHDGTASDEYQDPVLFFKRTYITVGMGLLLDNVVRRLGGRGGDPVIQLQTAFGGGKTHTMLAVYHLAQGRVPASELQAVPPILDRAGVVELPKTRVAVIDGIRLSPNQPQLHGTQEVHTLWGELAWQLGGETAYERVRDSDRKGTSPGKKLLADLLRECAPCVILMDELVAYVRQFEEGKSYTGGTFDSNLSFIQALTEGLKAVPTAVLLASLPDSQHAGGVQGQRALSALEDCFGRVHAIWKPVATEEAFEIVRRRLFREIQDRPAAERVCRAFADHYVAGGTDFPQETQEGRYYERLLSAYPVHPEVFARLYEDWSTLDNFQRTRGVLKLMAKVIHRLWKDDNKDLLILPGSLPLYDGDTANELLYYLPQGWAPVVEKDIDGERAETAVIEQDSRFGVVQAARRAARTVFLGSAPVTQVQTAARGVELNRILLGCVQPGQQNAVYEDALHRLTDRLHYLSVAGRRFWFDTRPNLRREMEERKRRFQDRDDLFPAIRDMLQKALPSGSGLCGAVHVFTPHGDIPDDAVLRLVVLPPDAAHSRTGRSPATVRADEWLKKRGDQPRARQNRLLFLAPDQECVGRLLDQVRSVLAWRSILDDYRDSRIVLDNLQAKTAQRNQDDAKAATVRMVREAYRWLLVPRQDAKPGKAVSETVWEMVPLAPAAPSFVQELDAKLLDNELVIAEWAPIHLATVLRTWFWKADEPNVVAQDVWHKMTCYLYLPRLRNEQTFRAAVTAGGAGRDFFGLAQGRDGERYLGFSFGTGAAPVLDGSLLLIEPGATAQYEAGLVSQAAKPDQLQFPTPSEVNTPAKAMHDGSPGGRTDDKAPKSVAKRHFYAKVDLDPIKAKVAFNDLVLEVVEPFASRADTRVTISVEIRAESPMGFDENLQRAVRENARHLKVESAEFEV